MKGNKYKIIVSTLILLCLCVVPAYALSLTCDSEFTNTGSYVGGYSYTTGSGYDYYSVQSILFKDGSIVDSDPASSYRSDDYWAQGDVGYNNPDGDQHWVLRGYHKGWISGVDVRDTTREVYDE